MMLPPNGANMPVTITTLSENTAGRTRLFAEWGLSILVEMDSLKVLLDTGQSFSAAYNAAILGIDLSQLDRIVLSHGHRDHTGGLPHILSQIKKEIEVIAHPDIWAAKYSRTFEERIEYAGIPFVRELPESLGASFTLTKEPVWINENVVTTGEIPMVTEFEKIDPELYVKEAGELYPDPLWDDQAVILKTGDGLAVILGCAHRGIINTLRHARKLTRVERVHTAIGGTHLFRAKPEQIDLTITQLKQFGIERLGVSHCTGLAAASLLAQEFGSSFFFNVTGTRITL